MLSYCQNYIQTTLLYPVMFQTPELSLGSGDVKTCSVTWMSCHNTHCLDPQRLSKRCKQCITEWGSTMTLVQDFVQHAIYAVVEEWEKWRHPKLFVKNRNKPPHQSPVIFAGIQSSQIPEALDKAPWAVLCRNDRPKEVFPKDWRCDDTATWCAAQVYQGQY